MNDKKSRFSNSQVLSQSENFKQGVTILEDTHLIYSPKNQLLRLPIFTTFFPMLRMTKQLPRGVRKLIFSSLASTGLQIMGMRDSCF